MKQNLRNFLKGILVIIASAVFLFLFMQAISMVLERSDTRVVSSSDEWQSIGVMRTQMDLGHMTGLFLEETEKNSTPMA